MKKIAFTIVLNGMPFIKEQYEIISKMFDKWYIIEGVAKPVNDTGWCKPVPETFHKNGLSIDGTTEFLNEISSDKIVVIRKEGGFWNGKTEMCNSFMDEVKDSILMQIDVDEFWSEETLKSLFAFCDNPSVDFDGMLFKCNFFVGVDLIVTSENCYSDSFYEWMRLWKIKDKTTFIKHEPPMINGLTKLLPKEFTKSQRWIFNHYAYILEAQLQFKEKYYGYDNAVEQWKKLQQVTQFPVRLGNYLSWVTDNTMVFKGR